MDLILNRNKVLHIYVDAVIWKDSDDFALWSSEEYTNAAKTKMQDALNKTSK